MYTVSKGPSKLVAKTRRGLSQNYEKIESLRDINRKMSDSEYAELNSVPKPIFHTVRKSALHHTRINHHHTEETITPQHEEMIKYIHESWNMIAVQNPYDTLSSPESSKPSSPCSSTSSNSASLYYVDPPSPVLSDFKPFDLESWWGRRLFNNITKSL